ncbi:MAG: 16S rRNA (guanine(966)-N(2))-methyltransferase RsmD [Methylophilales bacterium]|nr:16S rRNA (guanine(966)-N(2))-methyltransferase RsmD [Methylophilales bacterium]
MSDKKLNTVRINAGEWRSRIIKFPDAIGLRPTPERVRQTVFNWLGQDLSGLSCLDLFAGTGVMGFEALSRGALTATLVEKSTPAYKALIENKQLLKAEKASLRHQDALQFLSQNSQKFNLIFLDPPYDMQWLDKVLPQLLAHLLEDGLVYAESEFSLDPNSEMMQGWQIIKQSKAGNVFYHLLKSVQVEKAQV